MKKTIKTKKIQKFKDTFVNYLPFFLVAVFAVALLIVKIAFSSTGIPSTNEKNKSLGFPYVEQGVTTSSTMAFKFINPMGAQKCFEYRTDGDPDNNQSVGTIPTLFNNFQPMDLSTLSYPTVCVPANGNVSKTLTYQQYVEIRLYDVDNLPGSFYWDRFDYTTRPLLPVTKDDCQGEQWKKYNIFNNQGDCMSFVNETKNAK